MNAKLGNVIFAEHAPQCDCPDDFIMLSLFSYSSSLCQQDWSHAPDMTRSQATAMHHLLRIPCIIVS